MHLTRLRKGEQASLVNMIEKMLFPLEPETLFDPV